jgi:1-acyl-sn-glycerol-3-phosphate acyltransferase
MMFRMGDYRSRWSRVRRRVISVPAVFGCAVVLSITLPIWLPVSVIVDLVRARWRLPMARLLSFAVIWSWVECAGISRAFSEWVRGFSHDPERNYELMSWWTGSLMSGLRATTGLRLEVGGSDALSTGDAVVLSRHASLGDSLVSAWVLCCIAGLQPRYVLKKELLGDPCLDIVGLRVPNCFVDRGAADSGPELEAIAGLSEDLGCASVAVIFPEGTRASDAKRARALDRIAERDPARAARMSALQHLLPPRPAGSRALVSGAPGADIVLVWHTGFDGLDSFGGILRKLAMAPRSSRLVARRIPRSDVPDGANFEVWLDEQWLRMDTDVADELARV